jgi:glycine cleavage system H protein
LNARYVVATITAYLQEIFTMDVPTDLQYTYDHEWVRVDGDLAVVGITEYSAAALGDIVFVGLPRVGAALSAGQVCGEIESTRSVSELLNPIVGEVIESAHRGEVK